MIKNLFLTLACASLFAGSAAGERTPNVILIMADDVSWECFGSYGTGDYTTPNIDALAAKGVQFENCFSTPICTPSRVKLMTGQYNFRNYTHFGYLNPADKTFAQMLRGAGYKTAIAGKWQLNGLYHQAEDCMDNTRPYKAGFDEYCLWQLTKGKGGEDGGERFWSPPLEQNGKLLTKEDNHEKYGPDIMSDFLCDFMDRNKDEPFFIYYPSVLVHDPVRSNPRFDWQCSADAWDKQGPKRQRGTEGKFVAMVSYLDKIVGKIVNKVEEIGQLENTIILFTADNGTNRRIKSNWNGREITGGKGTTKDMGTHVPLVAYWKGHTPVGAKLDDLVDFTDFYATIAEAAKVSLGADDPIDGRSFLPQLQGLPGFPRAWVLCHYQPYWGKIPGQQYVRNQYFKLYRDGSFYHVPEDLEEANRLATGTSGEQGEAARRMLAEVMGNAPPAPPKQGGKDAKKRPTKPEWKNIVNPER